MSRHNAALNVHDPSGKHNISNLIYVSLIAPNTSIYPTAIVCSNHEPMIQSYTVNTEEVCNKSNQFLFVTYTLLADVNASVAKCLCF